MSNARDSLSPETLSLLLLVQKSGSFAAAARSLGLVPSALTYRIRQLEDALDILLFDRSSRQIRPTPAGRELLQEAERLLIDVDAVANRLKRIATGWESQFTVVVDGAVNHDPIWELCEHFFSLNAPTRLRIKTEVLSGTIEALVNGQADLAVGVGETSTHANILTKPIGTMQFPFLVAKHHALAEAPEPLDDDVLRRHRAVAVADSVRQGPSQTLGLLKGQEVFTVSSLHDKLEAQRRGIGVGFLPRHLVKSSVASGALIEKAVARERLPIDVNYAWRKSKTSHSGRALQWWLEQLESPRTLLALVN
jgi:DNA-binding transcriptional LysR family regulator